VIWNIFKPWPLAWWGRYFLVVSVIVPACMAALTTVWLGAGAVRDLFRLFRDLKQREINHLDNGRVEGHVSVVDQAVMEEIERESVSRGGE
jgi:hypothetical protein